MLPNSVKLVEVGPRDGLQNEKHAISVADKVALIQRLANAGVKHIEAGSFVNPKWVPQMANSEAVFAALPDDEVCYSALTPNLQGLDRALAAGAKEVAVFAAASEGFSQKNINCSIADSLKRFEAVMQRANDAKIRVRGYVSCVLGCPYDGSVSPQKVLEVSREMLAMGCYEISLGDTIGVGTPASMNRLLDCLLAEISPEQLAVHCHDTYGQALVNIYAAMLRGIATIDSSVAGLGGCPYAKGASGNVASEDVVYLLSGLGIHHGIDLSALIDAGNAISATLGRPNQSRTAQALTEQSG
ncbi:hydroxymethylglutaryl-CoA lyase [Spongiibacter marinus]|uniref:hydroxymethylglutaryl-CoA lyase n=1 Tax=Spongiibacter marinus TaxID=354246 RepID=UPI003C41EF85